VYLQAMTQATATKLSAEVKGLKAKQDLTVEDSAVLAATMNSSLALTPYLRQW
jgi:hypothetical protein